MVKGLGNYMRRIIYLKKCMRFYVEYKLNLIVKYNVKEIRVIWLKKSCKNNNNYHKLKNNTNQN
jgi:hypothetical protein